MAVLPAAHPAGAAEVVELGLLRDETFILTPRPAGPTLFDAATLACRQAGFEPILGQPAPQVASIISLVAAEFGVSLVPASMRQLQMTGVVYRELASEVPGTRLDLVYRRGDHSPVIRNFAAQALAQAAAQTGRS